MYRRRDEEVAAIDGGGQTSVRLIFYISIALILGVIAIMAVSFSILFGAASSDQQGPPGKQGIQGPMGMCMLNDTNQTFISGNLTIGENLIMATNSTIIFDNSNITETADCFSISSTLPLCLEIPYIQSSTNTTIFNNNTICFDVNCTLGIGPIQIGNETHLTIFGDVLLDFDLPLLIGDNGGYLDQLPGPDGGFLVASNPNSTGGIKIDSRGYGLYGNETFNEFITFLNYIRANGGLRMYIMNNTILIFDLFYGPYLGLTGAVNETFLIQSNQSALVLSSLTSEVNLTSPTRINILTEKIFLSPNSYFYNSNLSFDITSRSNQIGFYNGTTSSPLIGWIRSNTTCPISIGPLVCIQDEKVVGTLTIDSTGTIYFNSGAKMVANGTLNITAPNVFISNLTTNTFTVLGFTVFPGGISTCFILSTCNVTNTFTGPVRSPNIQATTQLSTLGTFSAQGTSTFFGNTNLNGNVTFNGNYVQCLNPIFQAGVPNACIPDCIDFYNCSRLRSIGYYGRNYLELATSAANISNSFTVYSQFGTNIDYITTNETTLSYIKMNANNVTTKTTVFNEMVSGNYNNLIGFNRTSISSIQTKNLPTFTPSNCLPLITIVVNSSGIPTPTTLSAPFYNYSNSSCTSINETYKYSNSTTSKDYAFMGSAVVKRSCTGGSPGALCTPFFPVTTKNFPFEELLRAKSLIQFNNTMDDETKSILTGMISNLVSLNLTFQSIVDLFFVNISKIITAQDTYELASFAFINVSGELGRINMSASDKIFIGEDAVIVDEVTKDLTVYGDILGSDGNDHPCCVSSSANVLSRIQKLTLSSNYVVSGGVGSASSTTVNFTSSTTTGTMIGFTASNSKFTSPKDGIYQLNANFHLPFGGVNVTDIGCIYEVSNDSSVFQFRKYGFPFSLISGLPYDGTDLHLPCSEFSVYLPQNYQVQIKIYTLAALNAVHTSSYTVTIGDESYIQAFLT